MILVDILLDGFHFVKTYLNVMFLSTFYFSNYLLLIFNYFKVIFALCVVISNRRAEHSRQDRLLFDG